MFDFLKKRISIKSDVPLWTKSFSILTVGTMVSYMGSFTMAFTLGLLVLDASKSVLLYSVYLFINNSVKAVFPVVIGPHLDRSSRKKAIYSLDFCSGALYFVCWLLVCGGKFQYWMVFIVAILISGIESIYRVAFTSLFPMLVHQENMPKAYSVFSAVEIISQVMVPVAAFLYKSIGIKPVFLICSLCYIVAAIIELFIDVDEKYVHNSKGFSLLSYINDFKESFTFLKAEKALLFLVISQLLIYLVFGIHAVTLLPYFNENVKNGYFWYMVVTGANMTGCFWGSMILYFLKIPKNKRYLFFVISLFIIIISSGSLLFLPLLAMIVIYFACGIFELTNTNLSNSSAQIHLSDGRKARYNGFITTATSVGLLSGQLMAGLLSEKIPLSSINFLICTVVLLADILLFLVLGRKPLKEFFNK